MALADKEWRVELIASAGALQTRLQELRLAGNSVQFITASGASAFHIMFLETV